MKKIISFLLLLSLLIVPLSSCELLDSILHDTTDEIATPGATTSTDTTPNAPDNTTPSDGTDSTTPDATTPTDTPDATPSTDTTEKNLVVELFGEGRVDIVADLLALKIPLDDDTDLLLTARDGNIYLADSFLYSFFYTTEIAVTFVDVNRYQWFVEEYDQIVEVFEKIENSEGCYVLERQDGGTVYGEILMYDIDGVYYFISRTASGKVNKLYCTT